VLDLGTFRTPTGVNSTPNDGATVWIAAKPPDPAGTEGSRITATRVILGAISFSSSSHFPLMLNSNELKPVATIYKPYVGAYAGR
jgi:hypothetical protein